MNSKNTKNTPAPHNKQKSSVRSVLTKTIRKHFILTALLVFVILAAVVTAVLPPLVLEKAVNKLAAGEAVSLSLALLYFLMLVLAGIFESEKEALITIFGQKITHGMRTEMSEKLARLPSNYFVTHESGAVVSLFTNDVDTVEALFASGVITMFADVCSVISIMFVIFRKSPGLGILLLIALPLLFWLTRVFQKRMLAAQVDNRRAIARSSQLIPETLRNLRTIRNLRKEGFMERRYDDSIEDSFDAIDRSNFYDAIYSPIVITVSALIVAVMMSLSASGGTFMAMFGMSVGTAVAVIAYVGKIFDPLENIGMEIQQIQSAAAGIKRIQEFFALEEREVPSDDSSDEKTGEELLEELIAHASGPAVSSENVVFGYTEDKKILDGFKLSVEKGEMVTLIGRTGAGKSTFFKLVQGLYAPWSGVVRVFGMDAMDIPDRIRRPLFGSVEQQFHLINGSIRDQITLSDPAITEEMTVNALKMVGLYDTVMNMPQDLDTPCTQSIFSQGEFQLLSIARATAGSPRILLLDEITAGLDSLTQARVLSALKAAGSDRTVLSISHRLYEETGGRRVPVGPE